MFTSEIQAMWNMTPRCTLIISYAIDKIFHQMHKVTLHSWGNNESYRKKSEDSEGNSYTINTAVVVSTLKETRKKAGKIMLALFPLTMVMDRHWWSHT